MLDLLHRYTIASVGLLHALARQGNEGLSV